MAKKPSFTEQQIVSYLLSGGTVEELSKNTKVTTNQILSAIVNNPQVFSSLKSQAEEQSVGLGTFDINQTYTTPDEFILPRNKYTMEYNTLNEQARELATGYMNDVKLTGNNPGQTESIKEKWTKAGLDGGMNEDEVSALIEKFESEKDKWFSEEMGIKDAVRTAQFKAYQDKRKALDLKTGDNPLYAAMSKLTGGYGKLADAINPDSTWEDIASTRAKGSVKGYTNIRDAEKGIATGKKLNVEKKTSDYIQGYLNVVAKKLPKGQTPFQTDVKKLLPYLQSNNPFGK
jgi:hypothetical protein